MAYLPADQYDYDLFISFSHRDNGLLPGQDPHEGGWVERFARFLEVWLRDKRGLNGLNVWLDKRRLSGATQIDDRIQGDLGRTGLLLVLHSHNYRQSDYCEQELRWFLDAAARQPAGLAVNNERRVFNILINNIQHQEWTQGGHWTHPLGGTLGFRFHDAAADDTQAFGDPIDPSDQAAYRAAMKPIVDAAYRLLSGFPREPQAAAAAPSPTGPLIFLADCPDTRAGLRKRLIQELGPRARIAAAVPPPYPGAEHDRAVAAALAQADLSIHLLDQVPGRDMDDTAASYPRRQADLARAGERHALFWLPDGLNLDAVEDPDHRDWLRDLVTAPRGSGGYQVLRGSPERLIADVLEQIQGLAQVQTGDPGARTLVVDPHQVDQLEGLELGFRLQEQARAAAPNLSLLFTRDATEPAERWDDFEQLVIRAHDLVVLFGRVTPQWVKRRVERAFKVTAAHLGESPGLRNIWVLLLPQCRGRAALPPLPPLIRVRVLDNTASPHIADATLGPLLSGGDEP